MMPKPLTRLFLGCCLVATFAHHSVRASDQFQVAEDLYAEQSWAAALEQFHQAAEQATTPDASSSAHFYAAECALQLKDYAQALTLYQQAIDTGANLELRTRACFRLAECQQLAGDLQGALSAFRQFIESYPRDELAIEARNSVGEILLETRKHEAALNEFAYVIENCQDQQSDRARLGMARALLALKRCDEVPLTLGRLCQSEQPTTAAEALLLLGRAQYESGQFDQSLATFRRIYVLSSVDEATSRARLAAGWALWKLSRLEEVAAEVEPLATKPELTGDFHYLLGMTAYSAKDWTGACKKLQLASATPGENQAAAVFYSGESQLLSGNPKSARASYSKLLESAPESNWADHAMWGLIKVARTENFQQEFDQACERLRSRYPASEYINQIPLIATQPINQLRQRDQGTDLFEEAVGLERDGRFSGAISAYQEFLAKPGKGAKRAEALWRTARLQERVKQYTESRKLYTQLLAEYPEFDRASAAMANLARIELETGNEDVAAKYYRDLTEKFPQSSQAVEASYWLAVAAADEKEGDKAQWQVDWLLERLNSASRSLSNHEQRVFGQTLCLQCQLFAADDKWPEIAELLGTRRYQGVEGAIKTRLDFWKAEADLRLGNYAESRKQFDELVTQTVGIRESWVPMVTLRRAQLASRREDWQEVLKLVGELDQKYPEFELAYECDYLQGRALAGRGEMSAARTAYGYVLENDWAAGTETAAMAQWMIGESYFHQRNYELARTEYERVIERHHFPEWQARAALQAGKCAELSDNWEAATNYYADAAERWQDTKSAHELSARLRWVQEQVAQRHAALRR